MAASIQMKLRVTNHAFHVLLVGGLELFQETGVVFREHAQILHLVFQIGDTFDAHAEGISRIDAAVYAVGFEHGRVYHAASENFHPSVCLQKEQPFPPQMLQLMSISAEGSVKGK